MVTSPAQPKASMTELVAHLPLFYPFGKMLLKQLASLLTVVIVISILKSLNIDGTIYIQ
jgi:hypothetical protein